MPPAYQAILLIAFGGPTSPEEVRPFLDRITKGLSIPPERLEEIAHHYEAVGGKSPLNEITFRQAKALEKILNLEGTKRPVHVGLRNSSPFFSETLAHMARDGIKRALGFILSSHQTEASWERYQQNIADARDEFGAALSPYVEQLETSARLIAERLGHPRWSIAYQSRSGKPTDPWLEPDIGDALRKLAREGCDEVIVAPIGFVCDHVEVLYDLDIEAKQIAAGLGVNLIRANCPNDHPTFIRMMAEMIKERIKGTEDGG
jgi:ferrochelatase